MIKESDLRLTVSRPLDGKNVQMVSTKQKPVFYLGRAISEGRNKIKFSAVVKGTEENKNLADEWVDNEKYPNGITAYFNSVESFINFHNNRTSVLN